jgi:hypothetical protein
MTASSNPYVLTTPVALYREFANNNWKDRLTQCDDERIDKVTEYEEGEREYRKRVINQHFENGVHIAMTITKDFWDGHSTMTLKMLLIDGLPHIVP